MPGKSTPLIAAAFIEPMECLPVPRVPEGPEWSYEIKLDGYRLEAVHSGGKTTLYSRRQNVLNSKFPYIAESLDGLPDATVIDGELVALSSDGRPNFNLLQNFRAAESHIMYYVFDVLVHKGHDLTHIPLAERRDILRSIIEPKEHLDLSAVVADRTAAEMLTFVREQGLEGVIGKRADSVYQPGQRSGLWVKHRVSLGQEFVVGRLLPWRGSRICCPRKSRIHSRNAPPGLRENQTSESLPLSLRESSRGRRRAMGTGTHSGQDEGMHLATMPHPA
jgi:ATP-dependent DNA ligase